MENEPGPPRLEPDEVHSLHVGLLLFDKDFIAIKDSVLPQQKVEDIVRFYCSAYRYTKASAHVQKLEMQGFQPGALMSGNMRNRVLQKLSSVTGRNLKAERSIAASFKGYDACSVPLMDLVGSLSREIGAATFSKAVFEEIETCGVEKDQLSVSELSLDWTTFRDKARNSPSLFDTTLWPALSDAGWKQESVSSVDADPADAASQANESEPAAPAQDVVYVPPTSVTEGYQSAVGQPLEPCKTPEAVITALAHAGQPVPDACIIALRDTEAEGAIEQCMHDAERHAQGVGAPHRHVHDPSAKRPGTPTTNRKFMCANCAINTSTVWRTGNAGLTLCNACGMFYNKHDHEHRPEHLIASARAKAEAQAAAAVSGANVPRGSPLVKASFQRGFTPDVGNTDGEMSDNAGPRRSSYMDDSVDEDDDGSRRPRRRRRAQANKWLATDDYLMLDGPLRSTSNQDFAAAAAAGGPAGGPFGYDDGRYGSYDGQRARYTASPLPARRRSRPGGYGGGGYYGRSRSVDPEGYFSLAPGQDDDDWEGAYEADYPHSYVPDRRQRAGRMTWDDEGADEPPMRDERPVEDMETLLGRILLHSTSDASDSSAADALVAMSQSCISHQEQRRLQASVSHDIRAASGSPAPQSAMRPLPHSAPGAVGAEAGPAAAVGPGTSPLSKVSGGMGGYEGWDAAAKISVPSRSPLDAKLQAAAGDDQKAIGGDAAAEMDVDPATADPQQRQDPQGEDAFMQAWSRMQPIATSKAGRALEHELAAPHNSPQAWYVSGQRFADEPQQAHSAPSHYNAAADWDYGHDQYGQQYQQVSGEGYYGVHSDLEDYADSGSRTASPTQTGKSKRRSQVDEDYPEPRGKGRTISRFGAEHKQQMDHFGVSRSQPGTPQKRDRGSPMPRSVRRTANGEPQRCANCGSEHTCLWRRDKEDPTRTLCNACGIYKTNNGIDRPTNGLFPSWKNGKERVVRRNVARPIFKPQKHQVLSADEFKAQQQRDSHKGGHVPGTSSPLGKRRISQQSQHNFASGSDIHPGALGLVEPAAPASSPAAAVAGSEDSQRPTSPTGGPKGVDPAILAELTKVARTSIHSADPSSAPASPKSSGAAILSAAMAAATAAARARAQQSDTSSGHMRRVGTPEALPARNGSPAVPGGTSPAAARAAAASVGDVVGNAQQPADFGVLGSLIQQAWAHAMRMHEPVMLPTGHKVFPDGRVVKSQVPSELGLSLPAVPPGGAGKGHAAAPAAQAAAVSPGEASSVHTGSG